MKTIHELLSEVIGNDALVAPLAELITQAQMERTFRPILEAMQVRPSGKGGALPNVVDTMVYERAVEMCKKATDATQLACLREDLDVRLGCAVGAGDEQEAEEIQSALFHVEATQRKLGETNEP